MNKIYFGFYQNDTKYQKDIKKVFLLGGQGLRENIVTEEKILPEENVILVEKVLPEENVLLVENALPEENALHEEKTFFENEVKITKEIYTEWYETQFREMRKKIAPLISISVVMLLVVAGSDLIDDGFNFSSIILIVCAALCVLLYFKGINFFIGNFYKKYIKLNGTEISLKFQDEKTEISAAKSSVDLYYNMIIKVIETSNLYLLFIQNGAYIVSKQGFTLGNAEEFTAFIKDKCPKAKYTV